MKILGQLGAVARLARALLLVLSWLVFGCFTSRPSLAQHIDYLLGSGGLLTAQQPPPSIYFGNQPTYYWASVSNSREPFKVNAGLDVFVDITTIGWTTPLTVLGGNYGVSIAVPLVNTTGSLDLTTSNGSFGLGRNASQFGLSSTYIEPINLGWHGPLYDAVIAFGVFVPTGPYRPARIVNAGLGRWAEMFSLGGTLYFDPARTWSVALESRYLTHQSQRGINLRAGDDLILEGGIGRKFDTAIGPVNIGLVGYAYWQVSDVTGSAVPPGLSGVRGSIYALGPEVTTTTKYGRYYLRFFSEFGGSNTPRGQELVGGIGLAF